MASKFFQLDQRQVSPMPSRHIRRVRRAVSVGPEEAIAIIGVDVMRLHHRRQLHRTS